MTRPGNTRLLARAEILPLSAFPRDIAANEFFSFEPTYGEEVIMYGSRRFKKLDYYFLLAFFNWRPPTSRISSAINKGPDDHS